VVAGGGVGGGWRGAHVTGCGRAAACICARKRQALESREGKAGGGGGGGPTLADGQEPREAKPVRR
jgi:hypothetical protein